MNNIHIENILTNDSLFSLENVLFCPGHEPACYADSFDKLGILKPVIVLRDEDDVMHLVDGRKRIRYAKDNRILSVDAVVLPGDTSVTDIITLLFCDNREDIGASVMNSVQFICFAITLSASKEWVLESLCVPLGLKPRMEVLRSCERINGLPEGLRVFCHEKKFSMKQLLNLTSYPDDLLGLLVEWNGLLHLTASNMDEIASNLRGWLRSNDKCVNDLRNDAEIMNIIDSAMDPRDKTARLRQLIRIRQYPVLSEVNSRIENAVTGLKLPKEIAVNWDRTLENKNAALLININDPEKWQEILDALGSEEVRDALKDILDEL